MTTKTDKAKARQLEVAAREIDAAWDAWMTDEEGEGMDRMERAIAQLRVALRDQGAET